MQPDKETFWDDLGVAWRASIPDPGLVSSRLETRLQRQKILLTTAGIVCVMTGMAACGLGAWTLWIGWSSHTWNFLTRGATLLAVSGLAIAAAVALRGRSDADTRSLRDMLRSSIARTERLIRAADLGCVALTVLAVGGFVGYAIRARLGRPPSMSPTEDLMAMAVAALGLVTYRWSQARALTKYRHLIAGFGSEDGPRQDLEAGEIGQ